MFDFGNVLVKFRPEERLTDYVQTTEEAMELRNLIWESRPWKMGDEGLATREESIDMLCGQYPQKAGLLRDIMTRCSEWLTMSDDAKNLLEELRQAGFGLYYISNTNPDDYAFMTTAHAPIADMDGGIASFKEGILKPDPRIYQLLLDRYGLKAEECLFIDDMPVNTAAAEKIGFNTLTLTGGADTLRSEIGKIPDVRERMP